MEKNRDENRKGNKAKNTVQEKVEIGQVPVLSPALARRSVRQGERGVSDLLVTVRAATGEVLKQCGAEAAVRAGLFRVREQVSRLSEEARKPLLERLDVAEVRLREVERSCALVAPAVPETAAPETPEAERGPSF